MIERKCASESETKRNRLSELITGSVPLAKPAVISSQTSSLTRRHHFADVNWITFGKISFATARTETNPHKPRPGRSWRTGFQRLPRMKPMSQAPNYRLTADTIRYYDTLNPHLLFA